MAEPNGRAAATTLADTGKRHFLEQEGLNAWGIWDFTQWDLLAQHLRKGFEYAQAAVHGLPALCGPAPAAPAFLEMYLPVVEVDPLRPPAGGRRPR